MKIKKSFLLIVLISCISLGLSGQIRKTLDNEENKNWPDKFISVEIKSSADGSMQKAWFYRSLLSNPQPLIVSLHSWSGDYSQEDPLTKEILLRDWNYIHPDFRGTNDKPNACGSDLVISDIQDAIIYAIKNGNVDTSNVHIIGASGGGYATLLVFMKLQYPVRSFNAWASISNLDDWYWECKGRGLKYAKDLEMVTTNGNGFNKSEAIKRSPLLMKYHPEKRKGSNLSIYAGIHDGYTGSVPISHSINMFNKLIKDMYPDQIDELVSDSVKISLLTKRINPVPKNDLTLGGRKIHLIKQLANLSLTIFEGGHEMLVPQALALIQIEGQIARKQQKLNIFTIGDSNGAGPEGWPEQLKKLTPYSTIVNKSISGNTIGFDNNGQSGLNTLKNIDNYLAEAYTQLGPDHQIDYIFINLGTNDTKTIFKDQQKEVAFNMSLLVEKIKQYIGKNNNILPTICIVTPSPMDEKKLDKVKYGGGDERIQKNNILFKKVANENHIDFLDTYVTLKKDFEQKTLDGVHLKYQTQFQLASLLVNYLNTK
jgi:lysophospholipase L1-like esterase